jgi:hypothetical protein
MNRPNITLFFIFFTIKIKNSQKNTQLYIKLPYNHNKFYGWDLQK